jgi:hypothetical protein
LTWLEILAVGAPIFAVAAVLATVQVELWLDDRAIRRKRMADHAKTDVATNSS